MDPLATQQQQMSTTDDHETMDESPIKTIAAARSKYIVCFSGKQYFVPEHAVIKAPTRSCPVADGVALGHILSSKSPEKWAAACDFDCLMVITGREGKSVYTTFEVEGHADEACFARLVAGHIADKLFPKLLADLDADPEDEAQQERLEVFNWTSADCSTPQLSPLTNQWEICIDTRASCRVDPERKARNFKNGGAVNRPNKRPIDEHDGETVKMPEAIKLIKHFKADDMRFQVLQHEGAVTVLGFAAPLSDAEVMHERDARLTFDAAEHAYWWDGKRVSMSVTGVWESYFPSFDSDATIQKFFGSWLSNPNSKYAALCRYLALVEGADEARQKQAIAALWEANRTKAAALGTRLHAAIETHLLTGQSPDTADTMPELAHYLQWRDDVASDWEPIKVEWKIYDERADVAGTIDSLWTDQTGKLVLVDWKRAKKGALEQKAYRNETGWGPCAALANNAMGHYTAQQNLYARILARCYGLAVDRIYLVQLHPDLTKYRWVPVPMMPALAEAMLLKREAQLVAERLQQT